MTLWWWIISLTINLTIIKFGILISFIVAFQTLAETPFFQRMLNDSIKKKVCSVALSQFIINRKNVYNDLVLFYFSNRIHSRARVLVRVGLDYCQLSSDELEQKTLETMTCWMTYTIFTMHSTKSKVTGNLVWNVYREKSPPFKHNTIARRSYYFTWLISDNFLTIFECSFQALTKINKDK